MKKEKKFILIFFLIFSNLIALSIYFDLQEEQVAEVVFFDVGQGDAALIRTENRKNILIDGGPKDKIMPLLDEELPFWDRDIDLMILTHAHADHLSGLVEVIKSYNVEKILWNKQDHDSLLFREWERLIADIPTRKAEKGQRINLGESHLDVLYPPANYDSSAGLNENSVVNRLIYENGAILFTGDAYKEQERRLLELERECLDAAYGWCRVMNLSADVLKVGHHGSSTSSDKEFIERVSPDVAIVSAGKGNRYGHPHDEVVELFSELEILIHKTYKDGNFRVLAD